MNEKQPSEGGPESVAAAFAAAGSSGGWDSLMAGQRALGPPLRDRRRRAWFGGMLAGVAIAIGLALVMHVIQQASPNGAYLSITGSVLLVLLVGLIIGLGLGMGLAAAVADGTAEAVRVPPNT
jgi:hypothetical protein